MYALSCLEQRDDDEATSDVFCYFLLFEQDRSKDVVVDEEHYKVEEQVGPCVQQTVLDPKRVIGVIIEDKLSERSQEYEHPHDGVDNCFLFSLFVEYAHDGSFGFLSETKVIQLK
jgi:hypothetical protein